MDQCEIRYEVIFTLGSVVSVGPNRKFLWSWVRLRADGFVTVRGKIHATMSAAIDAAAAYRRDHGGGQISVNIQESHHKDAQDVTYLT